VNFTMSGTPSMPPERRAFTLSVSGRVLLFTIIVWVGLLAGLQGVLDRVFRPTFVTVESELLVKDLERVEAAVARESQQLGSTVADYASWDEMSEFLQSEDEEALPRSLKPEILKTLDLDAIFIFDHVGRPKHSLHQKTSAELQASHGYTPKGFSDQFPVIASARAGGVGESKSGLVKFKGGTLVFAAAAPIFAAGEKALGTVVMLRELDKPAVDRLGEQVRLPLSLSSAEPKDAAPAAGEAQAEVKNGSIAATAWLRDPFGKPIASFTVDRAATILAQGEDTLLLGGIGSLFMLSLVLAMLLLLLQVSIVRPLKGLTRSIEEMRKTGELDKRLGIDRADEIGLLAYNFDRLLILLGERTRVLHELATTDGLTKLLNRRTCMEFLAAEIKKTEASSTSLSVLLMDIDHFKRINDTVGHGVGDRVLKQVAGTLNGAIQKSDRAGRYGGEEFLVILPGTSREEAIKQGNFIREAIEKAPVQGLDWAVTVSVGVAEYHGHTAHGILATADMNLYRAKEGGRNRVVADEIPIAALPAASIPPPASISKAPSLIIR